MDTRTKHPGQTKPPSDRRPCHSSRNPNSSKHKAHWALDTSTSKLPRVAATEAPIRKLQTHTKCESKCVGRRTYSLSVLVSPQARATQSRPTHLHESLRLSLWTSSLEPSRSHLGHQNQNQVVWNGVQGRNSGNHSALDFLSGLLGGVLATVAWC